MNKYLLTLLILASCKTDVERTIENAKEMDVVYVNDRGVCFAMVSFGRNQERVLGFTELDCSKVPKENK